MLAERRAYLGEHCERGTGEEVRGYLPEPVRGDTAERDACLDIVAGLDVGQQARDAPPEDAGSLVEPAVDDRPELVGAALVAAQQRQLRAHEPERRLVRGQADTKRLLDQRLSFGEPALEQPAHGGEHRRWPEIERQVALVCAGVERGDVGVRRVEVAQLQLVDDPKHQRVHLELVEPEPPGEIERFVRSAEPLAGVRDVPHCAVPEEHGLDECRGVVQAARAGDRFVGESPAARGLVGEEELLCERAEHPHANRAVLGPEAGEGLLEQFDELLVDEAALGPPRSLPRSAAAEHRAGKADRIAERPRVLGRGEEAGPGPRHVVRPPRGLADRAQQVVAPAFVAR